MDEVCEVSTHYVKVDSEWLLMQEQMDSGELDPFSMNSCFAIRAFSRGPGPCYSGVALRSFCH